jgi:hypothetical protein
MASPMPETATQAIIGAIHSPAELITELDRLFRSFIKTGCDSKRFIRHL